MTFKTFGISEFRIFAYKFFLAPTTSLKRTVKFSFLVAARDLVVATVTLTRVHHPC